MSNMNISVNSERIVLALQKKSVLGSPQVFDESIFQQNVFTRCI